MSTNTKRMGLVSPPEMTSRIQELRDDPHVCFSFLPERGVTGVLELDMSGVGNVIEEGLDDEILSHVGRAVDHERLHVDVVEAVDDRPPNLDSRSVVGSGNNLVRERDRNRNV